MATKPQRDTGPPPRFAAGDLVRVTCDPYLYGYEAVDSVGQVLRINRWRLGHRKYVVRFEAHAYFTPKKRLRRWLATRDLWIREEHLDDASPLPSVTTDQSGSALSLEKAGPSSLLLERTSSVADSPDPLDTRALPPAASPVPAIPVSGEMVQAEPPPPAEAGLTPGQAPTSAPLPPAVHSTVGPPASTGETPPEDTPPSPDPFRAGTIQISLLLYPEDDQPNGRKVFVAVRSVEEPGDPPPILRLARSDEVLPLGAYLEGVIAQLQADMCARAEAARLAAAEAQRKAATATRTTAARPVGSSASEAQPQAAAAAPSGGQTGTSPSPQHPTSRARSRTATPPSSPPAFQQLALDGL